MVWSQNRRSRRSMASSISTRLPLEMMEGANQELTTTMDRRMKPAAQASRAPLLEYTSELADEVVKTMPPPK